MNIIDTAIILVILAFGLLGAHRGVFKQLVITVGFILVLIISYYLKNPIAEFLSLHLPFFKFAGKIANISSLNIMFYQAVSFILCVILLEGLLQVIINITGIIEKVLKATIILGIPSKILGFLVGLAEGFALTFLVLFFLQQPSLKINVVNESKLSNKVLSKTPILSNVASSMVNTIDDIYELINNEDEKQLDLKSIDVMLEHKLINKEYVRKLIDNKKININGIDQVLNKYE